MTTTADLGIPLVAAQQAQPEVTHNEAVSVMQALLKGVINMTTATPPGSPTDGDTYVIAASPTGAWTGRAGSIAVFVGNAWRFLPGNTTAGSIIVMGARHEGMRVYNQADNQMWVWTGAAWAQLPDSDALRAVTAVGPTALTAADRIVLIDATSNNVTVTLPAANAYGAGLTRELAIKRIDASGNTATVQRAGADTIDAGTSFTLAASAVRHLAADGAAAWYSV